MKRTMKAACLSAAALLSIAAAPAWDASPWLADLNQLRFVIDHDYPNLEWLTFQREVSLDRWFAGTAGEIRQSNDDAGARRALESLIERFNDGHLLLRWPASTPTAPQPGAAGVSAPASPATVATFCASRGYDAGQVTQGTGESLPGYRPLGVGGPFPAGLVEIDGKRVGVLRVGLFSPQGYPALCQQAVANTRTAIKKPCDDACDDRLLTEAFALMTQALMITVERLRTAGAGVLIVDLTHNGGGTEWAEAAARVISPVTLRSAPLRVIPDDAWAARWQALAMKLRLEASKAAEVDRRLLLDLAGRSEVTANDMRPCRGTSCPRLVQAGFASGLLPELPAGRLDGRSWRADVFSPAQFPYRDHVWKGPLIVLVDSETWSAAEQFAALLQDNGAAIVIGTRTGGAGCGHLYGNQPITLSRSGAKLELPNCARFRKDGSNEVNGVVPDVSTGVRGNDGAAFAGRLTAAHLPEAIGKAEALRGQAPR